MTVFYFALKPGRLCLKTGGLDQLAHLGTQLVKTFANDALQLQF